jgi:hypothetical protein
VQIRPVLACGAAFLAVPLEIVVGAPPPRAC